MRKFIELSDSQKRIFKRLYLYENSGRSKGEMFDIFSKTVDIAFQKVLFLTNNIPLHKLAWYSDIEISSELDHLGDLKRMIELHLAECRKLKRQFYRVVTYSTRDPLLPRDLSEDVEFCREIHKELCAVVKKGKRVLFDTKEKIKFLKCGDRANILDDSDEEEGDQDGPTDRDFW